MGRQINRLDFLEVAHRLPMGAGGLIMFVRKKKYEEFLSLVQQLRKTQEDFFALESKYLQCAIDGKVFSQEEHEILRALAKKCDRLSSQVDAILKKEV